MYCKHVWTFFIQINQILIFLWIDALELLGMCWTELWPGSSNVRCGSTLVLLHLVLRRGNALLGF